MKYCMDKKLRSLRPSCTVSCSAGMGEFPGEPEGLTEQHDKHDHKGGPHHEQHHPLQEYHHWRCSTALSSTRPGWIRNLLQPKHNCNRRWSGTDQFSALSQHNTREQNANTHIERGTHIEPGQLPKPFTTSACVHCPLQQQRWHSSKA